MKCTPVTTQKHCSILSAITKTQVIVSLQTSHYDKNNGRVHLKNKKFANLVSDLNFFWSFGQADLARLLYSNLTVQDTNP